MWRAILVAAALAAAALDASCQPGGPAGSAASAPPSPTAPATPALVLAAPAQAILSDADAGLPRAGGTDALTPEEMAAAAPDQVLALTEINSWGWAAGAQRAWTAGAGIRVDDLVLLTDREPGAERAFAYLAAQSAQAPLSEDGCPAAVAGLDDCVLATAGARTVVVGRLGREVFALDVTGRDAIPLAARQAARLRAT